MDDSIHLSGLTLTIVGSAIGLLLALISYFMDRLIKQFDKLSEQFGILNTTMQKIDKDLSGKVNVLDTEHKQTKQRIDELLPIEDRVRELEKDVGIMKAGCKANDHCRS